MRSYINLFPFPNPDWTTTGERNQAIKFDINSTQLQVYTDSEIGSGDVMWLRFIESNSGKGALAGISVRFDSTPNYHIGTCVSDREDIPTNKIGESNHRIWTIVKNGSKVKLACNGVEIFHYDTQTSSDNNCKERWSLDFDTLKFVDNTANDGKKDIASDLFREHTDGK